MGRIESKPEGNPMPEVRMPGARRGATAQGPMDPMISHEAMRMIGPKLANGETVLWAGKPNPNSIAFMSFGWALLAAPLIVVWRQFKHDLLGTQPKPAPEDPLLVYTLAAAIVVVACVVAFLLLRSKARGLSYALTDRRAIIVLRKWGWWGEKHIDLGPGEITRLGFREKGGGVGHVTMNAGLFRFASGAWLPKGFLAVKDAAKVADLVRNHELAKAAKPGAPWYVKFLMLF